MEPTPAPAVKEPCWLCGEDLPRLGARRCNKCTAYQRGWRRWLPLLATLQMLSIVCGAVPFGLDHGAAFLNRNSRSAVDFAGVDARGDQVLIYAHLSNTGRQPSTVSGYCLRLAPVHAADATLLPVMDDKHEVRGLIPAGGEFTLPLLVRSVQKVALPDGAKVTLCADITESNGEKHCVESAPFDAALLSDVFQRRAAP